MTSSILYKPGKDNPNYKHGLKKHKLFYIWRSMKQRCYNPNNKSYGNYGGRGIILCKEWLNNVEVFYNWCIKNGYKDDLQIDRIDNDGNYTPENCRWVTANINNRNKAKLKNCSSKYIGVVRVKGYNKWRSNIRVNSIRKQIGSFNTEEEAVIARDKYIIDNNLEGFNLQILKNYDIRGN